MPEIKYYTMSKFWYEFEIPDSLTRHLPSDFDITSKLTKVKRYQTNQLRKLVEDLNEAEEALKAAISPFLIKIFKKFYKRQHVWSAFVNCIAEIDCLCSLAKVSKENNFVKPKLIA